MYQIYQIQDQDPSLPFYVVKDQLGNEVSWHTTLEEAQDWIALQ